MSGLKLKTRGELWLAAGMRRFYATFARRLEQGPAPDFRSHDMGGWTPLDQVVTCAGRRRRACSPTAGGTPTTRPMCAKSGSA